VSKLTEDEMRGDGTVMNNESIKCIDLFKRELNKFDGLIVKSFFPSESGSLSIVCDKKYHIKSESYAFVDKSGIEYDTIRSIELFQEEIKLLDDCEWELTPKTQNIYDALQEQQYEELKKNTISSEVLKSIVDCCQNKLTIEKIVCQDETPLLLSFVEIDDFYIMLFTMPRYGYGISIETPSYNISLSNAECRIVSENVAKDYKSFSSAAKSRFRTMAKELGYEQITGIVYVKEREGWYETFNLQSSQYGNPFFYFNYGVILPKKFPMTREELRDSGWNLGGRLCPDDSNSFPAGNKKQIEESAILALELYKEKVVPWFESLTLEKIKKEINK